MALYVEFKYAGLQKKVSQLKKYCKLFGILDESQEDFVELLISKTDPKSRISRGKFIESLQ